MMGSKYVRSSKDSSSLRIYNTLESINTEMEWQAMLHLLAANEFI